MITKSAVRTGTYAIDTSRSQVRFRATHSFGLGPVAGTFTVRDGTITVTPEGAEVTARVAADSFTTDKARRDADVKSKRFLHAEAHPDLLFTGRHLTRDGDRWLLHGRLTVRGTTAPVTLELESATAGADGCRFRARARVDRYVYKVGIRGIVGRFLHVEFDILGSPTSG
jgi:polyisoprenoid-binding protein YceI